MKKQVKILIFILVLFLFFNFSFKKPKGKEEIINDCLVNNMEESGKNYQDFCSYVGGYFDGTCHINEIKPEIKKCFLVLSKVN